MLINILFIILALGVITLALTIILHLFLPVPYVPTPRNVVERMIDLAKLKGDEVIYDLGAGDARFLIAAKRRYPNLIARGCEIVPTIWLIGKIRSWWSHVDIHCTLGSIERADVRDADVIFLYLIPSLMKKLEEKFNRDLKGGTRVISSVFRFPTKEPRCSEIVSGKRVFVYEW